MPYLRTFIGHPSERNLDSFLQTKEGHRIEASTLGEAIRVAEQMLQVRIVPHDLPKYFRIHPVPEQSVHRIPEQTKIYRLVDIHLLRNGEDICLKQDLAFPLLDSDVVVMGALVC